MLKPTYLPLILLIGLIVIVVLRNAASGVSGRRYTSSPLLTPNELEFYHRLKRALPGFDILAQVAMGALLSPAVPRTSRDYLRIRGTFAQKFVDFVICDPKTLAVIALVELDDRTHNAGKDAQRDAMLKEAGYHVVRWQSRNKPLEPDIRAAISALTGRARSGVERQVCAA